MIQTTIQFEPSAETPVERCRRVLAGAVGQYVKPASEYGFTPQRARAASERAVGEGIEVEGPVWKIAPEKGHSEESAGLTVFTDARQPVRGLLSLDPSEGTSGERDATENLGDA